MIIRSLAIPQILYTFLNLGATIPDLKVVNKLIMKYLWNGIPLIKKNIITQSISNGGLSAPDIYITYKSWALSWIKRLLQEDNKWHHLMTDSLDKYGGLSYLLQCNFQFSKLPGYDKIHPFLGQILQLYEQVNAWEPKCGTDISNQIINNNKYISIAGQSLTIIELKGLHMDCLKDWINDDGKFKSYEQMQHDLPSSISWLKHRQIISAIPQTWQRQLQQMENQKTERVEVKLNGTAIKNYFLQKNFEIPSFIKLWEQNAGIKWEWEKWQFYFRDIKRLASEPKIHAFQYRLIHDVLPTRLRLYRQKQIFDPNCQRCGAIENLQHMFYTCPPIQKLWTQVIEWFNAHETIYPSNTLPNCLLGWNSTEDEWKRWNILALQCRWYIYKSRQDTTEPNITTFSKIFKYYLKIRYTVAKIHKSSDAYLDLWGHWSQLDLFPKKLD